MSSERPHKPRASEPRATGHVAIVRSCTASNSTGRGYCWGCHQCMHLSAQLGKARNERRARRWMTQAKGWSRPPLRREPRSLAPFQKCGCCIVLLTVQSKRAGPVDVQRSRRYRTTSSSRERAERTEEEAPVFLERRSSRCTWSLQMLSQTSDGELPMCQTQLHLCGLTVAYTARACGPCALHTRRYSVLAWSRRL